MVSALINKKTAESKYILHESNLEKICDMIYNTKQSLKIILEEN